MQTLLFKGTLYDFNPAQEFAAILSEKGKVSFAQTRSVMLKLTGAFRKKLFTNLILSNFAAGNA
jgi:hypothetical protein